MNGLRFFGYSNHGFTRGVLDGDNGAERFNSFCFFHFRTNFGGFSRTFRVFARKPRRARKCLNKNRKKVRKTRCSHEIQAVEPLCFVDAELDLFDADAISVKQEQWMLQKRAVVGDVWTG